MARMQSYEPVSGHRHGPETISLATWVFSFVSVVGLFGFMSTAFFHGSLDDRVLDAGKATRAETVASSLFAGGVEGRSVANGRECDADSIRRVTTALLDGQQYLQAGEALRLVAQRCRTIR